ncbi:hypothetical protein [Aeoliella sp. SH292]|uniref:hypothetical protein n=1 Tax=Aeoliella sp. SH292 TaxID=3454464 RepID=UPI003F96AC4F
MRTCSTLMLAGLLLIGIASQLMAAEKPELVRVDLGFGNHYKVGSWVPLRITTVGGKENVTAVAVVNVPDTDGRLTSISTTPFSLPAEDAKTVELLARIGQLDSPVEVLLINAENGKQIARRQFTPHRELDRGGVATGEPATARMIVEVARNSMGTIDPGAEKTNDEWYTQNVVGRVADLGELPRDALAYEGIDTVVVSTSDREGWMAMRADDPRVRALVEWVEQGGRVVLYVGANSELVFGGDGALSALAPGDFTGPKTIDDLGPLETYVGGNEPLPQRGRMQVSIPTFDNLRGDVSLWLGSRDNRLPLIVRTRHQLGEVVLVGLDIDTKPLRDWKSRDRLAQKVLALADEKIADESQNYYYSGPNDLVLALQQRLDQELENSGIRTPPFLFIAFLVLLYILLIGPGDYFLVKRVLKRMEWTWVTFPIIVVLTCLAAYWYANYLKGDSLRVNQVEIVDVDNTTGLARGTLWTHIFTPKADRYTLALEPRSPGGEVAGIDQTAVAWLGKPAEGLGGMTQEAGMFPQRPEYEWTPNREVMMGVPIEVWSTRTFVSRWTTETEDRLDSDLTRTRNGLVTGSITNPTAADLTDCMLVYESWAWSLGSLPAGGSLNIEQVTLSTSGRTARKLRNTFQERSGFNLAQGTYYEQQQLLGRLDLAGIAEMMMLYDALGGRNHNQQWNRYQHFVDLSHSLDSQTAMLICRCHQPRSELVRINGKEPESLRGEKDVYVVIYRFLLPVNPVDEESEESSADN